VVLSGVCRHNRQVVGDGTLPFYLNGLAAGDDISFKVTNLTTPFTDDPTFTNLNLLIEKIPE